MKSTKIAPWNVKTALRLTNLVEYWAIRNMNARRNYCAGNISFEKMDAVNARFMRAVKECAEYGTRYV